VLAELEAAMPYSSEGLFAMSAQRGGGVKEVVTALRDLVDTAPATVARPSGPQSGVGINGRFLAHDSEQAATALARAAQEEAERDMEQRNYIRNMKSKRRGKIKAPPGVDDAIEAEEEYDSREAEMERDQLSARRAAARLTSEWKRK
jgi:hypothetical protein